MRINPYLSTGSPIHEFLIHNDDEEDQILTKLFLEYGEKNKQLLIVTGITYQDSGIRSFTIGWVDPKEWEGYIEKNLGIKTKKKNA